MNLGARRRAKRAVTKGIVCPGGVHFSTNYEYVRVEQVFELCPQSHLVCRGSGKKFGPADICLAELL